MNLKEEALSVLDGYKKEVWPLIETSLKNANYPSSFVIPKKYKKEVEFCWQIARDYPERKGKYLRPTLLCLTNEAMGGKRDRALITAAAMQISEEWLLIHDDIEDDSEMRRGKPALHKLYGVEQAINAGDILHLVMWGMLSRNHNLLGTDLKMRIGKEFARMLLRTAIGQGVEQKWTQENRTDMEDADWEFIADGKTCYYSIAGPMRFGAMIAGANEAEIEKITRFGKSLGRCFQLVDDLLDVTGNFSGLKTKANDLYEGKRTIMLIHLLNKASEGDRKRLEKFLKKKQSEKTETEVSWVLEKMKEYGSIDYAKKKAKKYQKEALEILENELDFLNKQPARGRIETLVKFILERDH